jgi:hypothetical protein
MCLKSNKLQAANKKQKAKKQGKRLYIANDETLTVAEGVNLVQVQKELQSTVVVQGQNGTNQRALPHCVTALALTCT